MFINLDSAKKVAINFLNEKQIKYTLIGNISFYAKGTKNSKHDFNYWVVPYVYMAFQEEDAFVYINDASQQVMYILTNHGYIYADKLQKAGEDDDNDDNWDDL